MLKKRFAVLGRGGSRPLFKLSHKVYIIIISALFGNMMDRHRSFQQEHFRVFNPGLDNIGLTGDAKLFLIEMLKVRRAEANLVRKIGNIPFEIRA